MRAHGRFTTMGMGARNRGNASKVNGSAGAKGSRQQPERVAVGVERKRWRGEKPPRRAACASSGGRADCDGRRQRRHLRRARGNTKCRQRRSRAAGLSLARTGKPGSSPRRAERALRQAVAIGQLPCNRARRPSLCSRKPPDYFEPRRTLAVLIQRGQIVFGGRVALECCGTVAVGALGVIAGNALAMLVQIAEEEFRVGVTLGSGGTEPLEGRLVVLIGGIMAEIRLREVVLSNGIALLGPRSQLQKRRADILLRLWRGVTGLNCYKHSGEKQQPCKKRV